MRTLLLAALVAIGCAPRPPLSDVTPSAAPPGVPVEPERARYQRLLDACERRQRVLASEVDAAQRRERREAGLALAAAQVAGRRDGDPNTAPGNPQGPSGDPCPGNDAEVSPCPSPVPTVVGDDPRSPTVRATDAMHGDAEREVEDINARIADADEFLFSHPDPRRWADDARETWEGLLANLASLCRGVRPAPDEVRGSPPADVAAAAGTD